MSRAQSRVHILLGHLSPSTSTAQFVESSDVAAPLFGSKTLPNSKSLQVFQKLRAFTQQALPFQRTKFSSNQLAFDPQELNKVLVPFHRDVYHNMLKFLADHPAFQGQKRHLVGLNLNDQREVTLEQLVVFAKSGLFRSQDILEDPLRWVCTMECLAFHGCNLATKAGVHFGLFGGTVMSLGNDQQRAQYADKIASLEVKGAFGLTELGHGSNARAIETVAEYDAQTEEFVLHTPHEGAQKFWIGNVACHGNTIVIFAQLTVKGKNEGIHAFVVPMRNPDGTPVAGVRTADCGPKAGLNGIDNGRVWLDRKRVPRTALLDRLGGVDQQGNYVSPIKSSSARFTAMISQLVGGRLVVSQSSLHMAKVGITIAIRYAAGRKQFGPSENKEIPILHYLSHQRRLFPLLAKTYALQFCMNYVKSLFASKNKDGKELHVLAAGLKPIVTWFKNQALQECREACGGMGFAAVARMGVLKNDSDIDVTYEGDNTVLLQQVAAALLKEFREQYVKGKGWGGMLSYLSRQLSMEIQHKNPFQRSRKTHAHLMDLDFYRHALEYREARMLRALVNRLRQRAQAGEFEAWNLSLDLALELARAHVDRMLVESFARVVETSDVKLQPILHLLISLFALTTIQANMGWYLTFNYFTTAKSRAIWEEINHLCQELAPHAVSLCHAFAIPDQLLDSPLAGDYVSAFSYPNVPGY
eukprot:TRINITY_DN8989_c0_g1_i2.p1 TRINITY_DN8989_c0_g1~~TRINITY_DN8989_c0_g1_i2.p1  ORF type:complete len:699 (+),score=168.86 TRINITY_DN8989_c0_g1_i2:70-2166(+)